jgi:hypothetical protein
MHVVGDLFAARYGLAMLVLTGRQTADGARGRPSIRSDHADLLVAGLMLSCRDSVYFAYAVRRHADLVHDHLDGVFDCLAAAIATDPAPQICSVAMLLILPDLELTASADRLSAWHRASARLERPQSMVGRLRRQGWRDHRADALSRRLGQHQCQRCCPHQRGPRVYALSDEAGLLGSPANSERGRPGAPRCHRRRDEGLAGHGRPSRGHGLPPLRLLFNPGRDSPMWSMWHRQMCALTPADCCEAECTRRPDCSDASHQREHWRLSHERMCGKDIEQCVQ